MRDYCSDGIFLLSQVTLDSAALLTPPGGGAAGPTHSGDTPPGGTRVYHAHVQELSPNQGPVTVFVAELGER